ncbi:hypothetical protein HDG34_007183 [Paraburkholderia sp. HC6.4b]|nr:hypothetical protein [Paraburkholderia sp. HC6.4b]MBB5450382.1 hypothetical protein [Paraburkholderia sp. Kb1A]
MIPDPPPPRRVPPLLPRTPHWLCSLLPSMNLGALQCFVILAEVLNFSRAAKRLHTALSQQIRSLDELLGTRRRRPHAADRLNHNLTHIGCKRY